MSLTREDVNSIVTDIVVWRSPIKTLRLFFVATGTYLKWAFLECITHQIFKFGFVPLVLAVFIGSLVDGPHSSYVNTLIIGTEFFIWWFGLGVLSSVGLGSGMHSGILFLFPFIVEVIIAANSCHSTDFWTYNKMWFRDDHTMFHCAPGVKTDIPVSFLEVFLKVIPAAFIWGAGTAAGEIPPYAVSYAAAAAGEGNPEYEAAMAETTDNGPVAKMKAWMVDFLQRWGFWGVVLMSAWPNAAFDLCGICCGAFMMPFWNFFIATFVGKAMIKVSLQSVFLIVAFSDRYLSQVLAMLTAISHDLGVFIATKLDAYKAKFQPDAPEEEDGIGKKLFSGVVFLVIGAFVISCINQIAQQQAMTDVKKQRAKKA